MKIGIIVLVATGIVKIMNLNQQKLTMEDA